MPPQGGAAYGAPTGMQQGGMNPAIGGSHPQQMAMHGNPGAPASGSTGTDAANAVRHM